MPRSMIDYTGETHGYLTALEPVGYRSGKMYWLCRCKCGNLKEIASVNIGRTISCGCVKRSALGVSNALRTKSTQRSASSEYKSWKAMIQRCNNPNAPNFSLYGAKGVRVTERWMGREGFTNFAKDMGKRPVGHSLDRINGAGNYEPSNCRWATAREQNRNRTFSKEGWERQLENLKGGRRHWPRKATTH